MHIGCCWHSIAISFELSNPDKLNERAGTLPNWLGTNRFLTGSQPGKGIFPNSSARNCLILLIPYSAIVHEFSFQITANNNRPNDTKSTEIIIRVINSPDLYILSRASQIRSLASFLGATLYFHYRIKFQRQ